MHRLTTALADRYRIERELGEGGMATVYLAHDLKHDRDVAIKVLHPDLGAALGGERFLSEIKTTAKLQHPHILPLLDSGDADGLLYYVMPVVTGETLRTRLERERQLPIPEAVRIAREVASALDYAHRQGVIHRDIKPENILLHDGQALVADFGISLAVQQAGGQRMTQTGLSLGTPQYMSPEQAMGEKQIDARSDVYALGAVTYEMLAGDAPFTGSSVQAIVAKVLAERPTPLHTLRDTVPAGVEDAVLTALAKLPADRFATAAEFAAALANPTTTMARTSVHPTIVMGRRGWLTTGVFAALALIAGLVIGGRHQDPGSVGRTDEVRATLTLGDSTGVRAIGNIRLAISPSGRRIAFIGPSGAETALWVRDLDQPTAHQLPDTKGAFAPFFSPDGETIGFFTAAGGATLKVIAVTGGVARTVVQDSVAGFGADWGDDGQIYFTDATRSLARVASTGGAVTRISHPDTTHGVTEHDYADVLPGSRRALVMLWKGSNAANHIGLVDLATGAVTDLVAGTYARYVAAGFLAIGTADGRVLAVRFDPHQGRIAGAPVLMLQNVQQETSNGTLQFAVSATGTVVFEAKTGGNDGLVWVDRGGGRTPVDTALTGGIQSIALSPDGTQIAMSRAASGETSIWVKQLTTGALSRLSFDVGTADRPVWTPDGRKVAFLASRDNHRKAWVRRADGSDSTQAASHGNTPLDEIAFDPLGRYTLFRSEGMGPGSRHLFVVENGKDTIPRILVQSRFDHYAMVVSPDGHWLAYVSEESGAPEVYVRPFPNVDSARYAISVGGGMEPVWRRDGTELFFRNPRGAMLAAPVTTGRHFEHGTPELLFSVVGLAQQEYYRSYDVDPTGKRFLMVTSGGVDANSLNVIFNWRAELEKLK